MYNTVSTHNYYNNCVLEARYVQVIQMHGTVLTCICMQSIPHVLVPILNVLRRGGLAVLTSTSTSELENIIYFSGKRGWPAIHHRYSRLTWSFSLHVTACAIITTLFCVAIATESEN